MRILNQFESAIESVLILLINENNLSTLALETGSVNKSSTKSKAQLQEFFLIELNILCQTIRKSVGPGARYLME